MAKYRLLNSRGYNPKQFKKGMIYDGYTKSIVATDITIKEMAEKFPDDWEKVEESNSSLKTIYNSLLRMQEAKDKAYGNSALKPLDIFAKHHNYGARIDEKLARVQNSSELRKNDIADIVGGLVLICKDKGWTNFDDLID
jgi:hypothetical protein